MAHLWEREHPYYCSESEYHTGDHPEIGQVNFGRDDFESWADFFANWGFSDPDMNLVFRWDWHTKAQREKDCGYDDYTEEEKAEEGEIEGDLLEVFFVLQRKGLFRPCHIKVTAEDEPAVREWLATRSKTILSFWEGI